MPKIKSDYPQRLYFELRKKFWTRSDSQIVCHDIFSDINTLKKYEKLNAFQMAKLFIHATTELDGEGTAESFVENWRKDNEGKAFIYAFC